MTNTIQSPEQRIIAVIQFFTGKELYLTGSRFFGTATLNSDWDFLVPFSSGKELPINFERVHHDTNSYCDPTVQSVWYSRLDNCHLQIIWDEYLPIKLKIQDILRANGALCGVNKIQARNIWTAMVSLAMMDKMVVHLPVVPLKNLSKHGLDW